jgi:hypothetical protein
VAAGEGSEISSLGRFFAPVCYCAPRVSPIWLTTVSRIVIYIYIYIERQIERARAVSVV